jgi:predicted transglutaminase-like cysteine proteinase
MKIPIINDIVPGNAYRLILYGVLFIILGGFGCSKPPPQVVDQLPPEPAIASPTKAKPSVFQQLQDLITDNRNSPIHEKLVSVNNFFNQFAFVEDQYLWGKEDYWATPSETLARSSGDCEDFTIAKYFTLRDLNVPEETLRLTYVISLKTQKRHMVLTYLMNPWQEPVVLDTMHNRLLPVSRRPDLIPVYSFNSDGYWLSEQKKGWSGDRIGNASRLPIWWNLLQRMDSSNKKILHQPMPIHN